MSRSGVSINREERREFQRIGIECINFNLRRAARISGRLYDRALQAVGLTGVQFSLLSSLAAAPRPLAVSELARVLSMDRTTLTRDLRIMRERKLIREVAHTDRRKRLLTVTKAGLAKLREARPLRESTQVRIEKILGRKNWTQARRTVKQLIRGEKKLLAES